MSLKDEIPGSVPGETGPNPITTSEGEFALATSIEITERKKAQERFQLVVEAAPNAMIMVGDDGLMHLVNVQTEKLFGYDRKELLGRPLEMLVPERFRSNHRGHRSAFFVTPAMRPMGAGRDLFALRKDGSEVPVEIGLNPISTPDGRFVLASIIDITERKKAQERFQLVVEAAPNAMIMVGSDGLMNLVNVQTEKLFGYERQELLGRPFEMLVPKRFRFVHGGHRSAFFAMPATRPMGAGRDLFGLRKDGSEVPVEIGLNPINTLDEQFVLASIVDITERKKAQELLHLFKALIDGVKDYGIFMVDPEGYVLSWNEGAARITGYSERDILRKHLSCFYTPEAVSSGHPEDELRIARTEGKFEEEGWRVRRDGSRFWASVLTTTVLDENGKLRGFSKLTRDITERKQSDERLLESERSMRLLADAMPQIVFTARPDGYADYYNRRWYELTGFPEGKGGDESWKPIVHPDDLQICLDSWYDAVASGLPYEMQYRFWDRKRNCWRWYLTRALPIRNDKGQVTKWFGTSTDVDDYKRLHEELEHRVEQRTQDLLRSLVEKETLLKEVHHRVKNNLQVICSLLALQIDSCSSGSPPVPALQNAYDRVQSMALIHESLYQSATLSDLDFGAYIEILTRQLLQAYRVDAEQIQLESSVGAVRLTVDQAIPCGLILNELISNSLKHAFRDGRRGVIRIFFAQVSAERLRLTVADNGVGLTTTFALEAVPSLGLQIVRTLVGQLGADLQIIKGEGTHIAIEWPLVKE